MKVPVQRGSLYNDEVNVPVLSPRLYETFVLPYEADLSVFHGGITYWHSCGNITPLLDSIRTIPNLEMVHISPWSDIRKAVESLRGRGIALEIVLHPYADVQGAPREHIVAHLKSVRKLVEGIPSTVRADGLQVLTSVQQDVKKIKQWADIANELLVNAV
jgi:hypothetical protein